jgi:hypothetical protein
LFYYHNYEEFVKIDLNQELKKETRYYRIPGLFSKLRLISPYDGEKLTSTTVAFRWQGKPDHQYEVIYSTDPLFRKSKRIFLAGKKSEGSTTIPVSYFVAVFIPFIMFFRRNGRTVNLIIVILALTSFPHCGKEDTQDPETTVTVMSETVSDLLPDTTYHWKIEAYNPTVDGFHSETRSNVFRTGQY